METRKKPERNSLTIFSFIMCHILFVIEIDIRLWCQTEGFIMPHSFRTIFCLNFVFLFEFHLPWKPERRL